MEEWMWIKAAVTERSVSGCQLLAAVFGHCSDFQPIFSARDDGCTFLQWTNCCTCLSLFNSVLLDNHNNLYCF